MAYLSTEAVAERINLAMTDKQPFSLIRLGDGEARLIGWPDFVSWRDLNSSLDYWYGPLKPPRDDLLRLRADLIAACQNADVLGIPRQAQQQSNPFYKLMVHLVGVHGLARHDTAHCGVHRFLMSEGHLADLLRGLDSVTVITCRDVGNILCESLGIGEVRWIPVPEEAHMATPQSRHHPERHNEVLREIDAGPGDLYLVGAGPNGKVYCDAVKRDGGIGLDLGSIFDAIAGVHSRSYIAKEPERYQL